MKGKDALRGFASGPLLVLVLLVAGLVLGAYLVGRNTGLLNFAAGPLPATPSAVPSGPGGNPSGGTGSQPVNINPPSQGNFPIGKYCATDQDCNTAGTVGRWKCIARLCAVSPD